LILISLIFFSLSSLSSYACATQETVIDSINIGDILEESDHNLFGWGPIEPMTHGGSWGGADDGNLRVIWYNDAENPSDVPTQNPDENWASVQLNVPAKYIPTKIHIHALDGIADDSFEVYINDLLIYSYNDEGSIETWKTHEIDVSYMDLFDVIELKIKSISPAWSNFDKYGQLAISWINLYGIEGEDVTIRLVDSTNNPLENGYVEYYKNGWKEFGITDTNGNVTKLIPKGKYTFRMSYLGSSISLKQDVSIDPVVIFSTVEVTVKFENSSGFGISEGNVSFYSGSWKFFGITNEDGETKNELLPRTYSFRMSYLGSSVSLKQDINIDPVVIFSTVNVTVGLFDSIGNPLDGAFIEFNSGGWKSFGTTDLNGEVKKEFLPKTYTFRVKYDNNSFSKKQDVSVDAYVIFNTINVTIKLQDSNFLSLADGDIFYYSSGWKYLGVTDDNGSVYTELLPITYTFKVTYDGSSVSKKQDISNDYVVVFSTVQVVVRLQNSSSVPLSGGNVSFYSGGWKFFGLTDINGEVKKEILPVSYTFRMRYDETYINKKQDVSSDPNIVFSTIKVSVVLQDSLGTCLLGGNVSYYSGSWKFFGITNEDGETKNELLPKTYSFRMSYLGSSVSLKQDVSIDPVVIFSTVEVTVKFENSSGFGISEGNVSFYSSGWRFLGFTNNTGEVTKELLSKSYTFKLTYDGSSVSLKQDVSIDPVIIFNTVRVTANLFNSSYIPLQNGTVEFYSGSWKFFGVTDLNGEVKGELLPKSYTFRVFYDGSSVSLKQDVSIDSDVVFSTLKVTVVLQDSIGNCLLGGNVSYYSGSWRFFGITNEDGETKNELLPRTYNFRVIYKGKRYTAKQNVGENPIVIINTDTIENHPPVADAGGHYVGYVNKVIKFNGSKSYDPDGNIVNYTWDFGDTNIGYGIKPEHVYSEDGQFIVNLTVIDNKGLSSYNVTYVKVTFEETNTVVNNNYKKIHHIVNTVQVNEEKIDDSIVYDDVDETVEENFQDIQNDDYVEFFDESDSDETTVSCITPGHVTESKEINKYDSSQTVCHLSIEWWFVFFSIIFSLILVLYVYKKRCLILKKLKSTNLISKNKQERTSKVISLILKLFYM
jgi:hypothetical protein